MIISFNLAFRALIKSFGSEQNHSFKSLGGKKKLICVDCGKEFEVDSMVKGKKRCDECQEKHRLETYRISKKKIRKSKCPQS